MAEKTNLLALAKAEFEKRERMRAMKEEAEQDFLAFVRMMWPVIEPSIPLQEGWVLDMLADVMMSAADGHLKRICINVPPGSMKSSLLNVFLPAWLWGPCARPSMRFLSISYSDKVPIRDNLRFALMVKHPVYQSCWGKDVKITRDGAEWVSNDRTGWKAVTSVSGSTTGLRADILLLDDLNNPMDVESDTVRNSTNRFVREIMPTRLNSLDDSIIINLQQRTHQDDASGTLMEHGDNYTFICIPAEFDPLRICRFTMRYNDDGTPAETWIDPRSLDDNGRQLRGLYINERGELEVERGTPMARAMGESFWPERFPDPIRSHFPLMTQYAWDSQFNQIPGVRGGAIIRRDWWKLWKAEEYPPLGTVVVSVDTAYSETSTADWNACTVWGAFGGDAGEPLFLLMAAWRIRAPLADLVRLIAETCRERKADFLLVENKTRGKDVSNEIRRLYSRASWETILVNPEKDKVARMNSVSHLFSGDARRLPDGFEADGRTPRFKVQWSGGVVFAPNKDWTEEVITEVASFPYGIHDDYCDTVSQCLAWCRVNGVVVRRAEYDEDELERNRFRKPAHVPYSIR